MSKLIRSIIYNRSTRILFYFYLSILVLSTFFIIFSYYSALSTIEEQRTERLRSIAAGLAVSISAEEHQYLIETNDTKNSITKLNQNPRYDHINKQLRNIQLVNDIKSPIYTLVLSKSQGNLKYGVRSDDKVFYLNDYSQFPEKLIKNWELGGTLPKYETENGQWISAFYPIKNSLGETVAVVEVDEDFGQFISSVNSNYKKFLLICIIVIALITAFLIPVVQRILQRETAVKDELILQKKMLESFNRDVASSVDYASTIQQAMLPDPKEFESLFKGHFILFKPRDTVSGDFYWSRKTKEHLFFAVSDCTGHGVPGALMSMIGSTSLNALINQFPTIETGQLLDKLDSEVYHLLSNKSNGKARTDGMDIGIIRLDLANNLIQFSGAFCDLVIVRNTGLLEVVSANRFPIGGANLYTKVDFCASEIQLNQGDRFYLYSDGFQDQFGGPKGKKYRKKKMKDFLIDLSYLSMSDQGLALETEFLRWKQDQAQVDDVLVVGFEV